MLSRTWLQCPLLRNLRLFLFCHCMCLHISPVEDGMDFLPSNKETQSPASSLHSPPIPHPHPRASVASRHTPRSAPPRPPGFCNAIGCPAEATSLPQRLSSLFSTDRPQPWSPRRMKWTASSSPTCWTATRPRAGLGPPSARALVALLRGRELFCYPTRKGARTRLARLQTSPLEHLVQHHSVSPGPSSPHPDGDLSNRELVPIRREPQHPQHVATPLPAGAALPQKAGRHGSSATR